MVAGQRVTAFVDFVNDRLQAYDDNGHGTHVAGIIAGNGYDSNGAQAGIAPAAHLVSLKVLDQHGGGVISDVIAAFEWAVRNRVTHNIRVINLSVGARVSESYETDPLTLAAKRAVDAGIVVVTAAGNLGQRTTPLGTKKTQYGSITAPGNAPWVLTVGAYSTEGTLSRWDDKIAPYSSRGPSAIDYVAKPDIVAPGTGIVSLSNPASEFYLTKAAYLLKGTQLSPARPYLSLSGTSMASPVVAGTVALMLQANPNLKPNLVKAILQVHGADAALRRADTGRRVPQLAGGHRTRALLQESPARAGVPALVAVEPSDPLGRPPHQGRRDQAGRQCVGVQHRLGHAR